MGVRSRNENKLARERQNERFGVGLGVRAARVDGARGSAIEKNVEREKTFVPRRAEREGGDVKISVTRTLAVPPEPVRAEESPAAARAPAPSLR